MAAIATVEIYAWELPMVKAVLAATETLVRAAIPYRDGDPAIARALDALMAASDATRYPKTPTRDENDDAVGFRA